MLDYTKCPHRDNVKERMRKDGTREEICTCLLITELVGGYNAGMGDSVCKKCAEIGTDFTFDNNAYLRKKRLEYLHLPFGATTRIPPAHPELGLTQEQQERGMRRRKIAIRALVEEDGYTVRQIQDLLLDAASKDTITEGEVGELDDYAREQSGTVIAGS